MTTRKAARLAAAPRMFRGLVSLQAGNARTRTARAITLPATRRPRPMPRRALPTPGPS